MTDIQRRRGRRLKVKPLRPDKPEQDWHWSYTLMLVGLFVGGGAALIMASYTLITWTTMARIYLLVGLGLLLIPHRLYHKWFGLERLEVILGSLMGIAPIVMVFFLGVNMLFSSTSIEVVHAIKKKELLQNGWSPNTLLIHLQDSALKDHRKARMFDLVHFPEAQFSKNLHYHILASNV